MSAKRKWTNLYVGMACFTLAFQIGVRSFQCRGVADCGLSFGKAAVWTSLFKINGALA